MLQNLESVIPQILTLVIFLLGFFGKGLIDSSADQLAEFVARGGGGKKQAVKESSIALCTSLLTLMTFFSSITILLILCVSGSATGKNPVAATLFAAMGVLFLAYVFSKLIKHSAYEISMLRIKLPSLNGPKMSGNTIAGAIDIMNFLVLLAVLVLPFL